jgi:hypothetical protein
LIGYVFNQESKDFVPKTKLIKINFGCGGPGFDPTPKPRMALLEALISLLSDNRLKIYFIHL